MRYLVVQSGWYNVAMVCCPTLHTMLIRGVRTACRRPSLTPIGLDYHCDTMHSVLAGVSCRMSSTFLASTVARPLHVLVIRAWWSPVVTAAACHQLGDTKASGCPGPPQQYPLDALCGAESFTKGYLGCISVNALCSVATGTVNHSQWHTFEMWHCKIH